MVLFYWKGEQKKMRKREMKQMTKEQLRELAKEKNKKGIATWDASCAQYLLWEERYPERISLEDDYEGWIDEGDDNVQNLIDEIYLRRYFWKKKEMEEFKK